ncbi:hypothetical protein [Clavibacter nebraskensis]|uniref:Integral membrane protein n=2 Tax=Clavibacter nebraskensis TaxID=31963 RepID=A0A399QKH9_9MICO|nr:hypothetical protein [Clavibacter nebraskensis]KXU19808.1 hypothetical protein VV38_12990 [Clavibacter nebraskensis]OAH17864.1 hypothetical protein A3Q38_13995 [Clavibacter nebraskensis]QGV67728.1 hypothetical protein EGX36_13385 [Clavibacter nebraskensis]QGV70528.1 hypothetical protein EGX37_13340 [Clavibacter nebraskensis]QGV73319.1 hypothetical protein EGX35_13340 [Clavibacter nebraskensis]
MTESRTRAATPVVRAAFAAASAAYLVNCAIGIAAATRILPPRPELRLHHRAYVLTSALTAVALASPLWSGGAARPAALRAARALAPAVIPLAALPRVGTRTRRHPAVALTAAPWFARGILATWS